MKTLPILLLLSISVQGQRPISQYVLDWSPQHGTLALSSLGIADTLAQVFPVQQLEEQGFIRALHHSPNIRALLYIHCWLGENRFFHRRSMGWLAHSLQTSSDTSPVVILALRWPSGKRGYRRSALQAEAKGAAFAPVLRTLTKVFPDGRLDVFCHSMGNRFFQGCVAAFSDGATPQFGHVVLFSPDVDSDVFCGDFEKLGAASTSLHLYTHRRDRALWLSQRLLHRPRLGRSGPSILPDSVVLDITDMTLLRSLSNHTHFADKVVHPRYRRAG